MAVSDRFLGCVLVALSSCTFTATAALVKIATSSLLQLMEGRFLVSWLLALSALGAGRACTILNLPQLDPRGPPGLRCVLLLRGAIHWLQVAAWWLVARRLPLGDVTAAAQAAPLVSSVLASKCLGEALSRNFRGAAILAVIGMACLSLSTRSSQQQGDIGRGDLLEGMLAFCAAFSAMCVLPLLVRISRGAHWLEVEHVSAAVAALAISPASLAIAWFGDYESKLEVQIYPKDAFLLGGASFIALCLQTRGFQLAEASIAPMMWYIQVPFSYCLQWLLFSQRPSLASLCGGVCLLTAAVVNMLGAGGASKGLAVLDNVELVSTGDETVS